MARRRDVGQHKRVTIYTTPVCPWCVEAKRHFSDMRIEFTEVDISTDRRGKRRMVLATGQHGVPVVVVGEKAMVGWNREEFDRLMSPGAHRDR